MLKIPLSLWRLALSLCLLSVLVLALMPNPPEIPHPNEIKTNHLLAFAVIMILGNYSFQGKRIQVILGSIAFGSVIEALQLLTSCRHAQFSDIGVDAIGVLIGLALLWVFDFVKYAHLDPSEN
jgi:VanZ family protein